MESIIPYFSADLRGLLQPFAVDETGDGDRHFVQSDQRDDHQHIGDQIRRCNRDGNDRKEKIRLLSQLGQPVRIENAQMAEKQHDYRQLEQKSKRNANIEHECKVVIRRDDEIEIAVGQSEHKLIHQGKQYEVGKAEPDQKQEKERRYIQHGCFALLLGQS